MIKSINIEKLSIQDVVVSSIIILVMSTIIANIYNPLLGLTYGIGNVITLIFLSWLYQDTWSDPNK